MTPRTYQSKVRADAARSTRAVILDAARTVFLNDPNIVIGLTQP